MSTQVLVSTLGAAEAVFIKVCAVAMYQERFRKVLQYIDSHLDENLTVESLSAVAQLSKYHFHRQFSLYFGLSVSAYIKRLRLKRASYRLAFRCDAKVIDVALAAGYESSEAFSRAFKKAVGQSPSVFRNEPKWIPWHECYQSLVAMRNLVMKNEHVDITVDVTVFEETRVAVLEHRGAPALLGDTLREFIAWRKQNRLAPNVSRTFNFIYDDPKTTDPEDYRFGLAASIGSDVSPTGRTVVASSIPRGRCARVRHTGSDHELEAVVRYLYSDWLESSGEQLRDFPLFFERVRFFPDVPEHEMVTDVYLPLC